MQNNTPNRSRNSSGESYKSLDMDEALAYTFVGIPKVNSSAEYQPQPTGLNRVVLWKEGLFTQTKSWYISEQLKQNPGLVFLFGDNDSDRYNMANRSRATGGQARVTRDFDWVGGKDKLNEQALAVGITTTFYNSDRYTPTLEEFKVLMDSEFTPLIKFVKAGGCVVIPCSNNGSTSMGTAIANLERNIPGASKYLNEKIKGLEEAGKHNISEHKDNIVRIQGLHQDIEQQSHKCREQGDFKKYVGNLLTIAKEKTASTALPKHRVSEGAPESQTVFEAPSDSLMDKCSTNNSTKQPSHAAHSSPERHEHDNGVSSRTTPIVVSYTSVTSPEHSAHNPVSTPPTDQPAQDAHTDNEPCCLDGKKKYILPVIGCALFIGVVCAAAVHKDIGIKEKIAVCTIFSLLAIGLLGGILLSCKKDMQSTKLYATNDAKQVAATGHGV